MTTSFLALEQAAAIEPADLRRSVQQLEARASECQELAGTCVTDEARDTLLNMAEGFRQEAKELSRALARLTQLCSQALQAD